MSTNLVQSCQNGRVSLPNGSLPAQLIAEIQACGFYPSLAVETAVLGVAGREVLDFLVQHEATFAGRALHRHLTILLRTAQQLVICHVEEGENDRAEVLTITESVALRAINSVVVTRALADPENAAGLRETWLSIVWGAARRVDLGPANCEDPSCEADHGYSGVIQPDDITVRMSPQVDGDNAQRLVAFGSRLQEVIG